MKSYTFVKWYYPGKKVLVEEINERVVHNPGPAIACQFFDRVEKDDGKLGAPINVSPIIYFERRTRLSRIKDFFHWLFS